MKHIHLIGIGGTGLSAIARVLLERGYSVSGSDLHYTTLAESLASDGATIYIGHQPDHVNGAEIVIRSSAVPDENIEVQAALSRGIKVVKRADFLAELMKGKTVIAVAGTHGKTSTTAMISWMFTKLGLDPSFILGGVISKLGTNARAGSGAIFVIEADEYDRMFLGLNPKIAVITNIEHDHPDCYLTEKDYLEAFRSFAGRLTSDGILILCGDDPQAVELLPMGIEQGNKTVTYGYHDPANDYLISLINQNPERSGYRFQLCYQGRIQVSAELKVPGIHNVFNACAALVVADQLGLPLSEAAHALSSYRGTERRFEVIGNSGGVTVISDYAHHPTEIRATLSTARSCFPDSEIWAVWQPHTYSRTRLLFDAFIRSFDNADHVLVTEIYAAREPVENAYLANQFVDALNHPHVVFTPRVEDAAAYLEENLQPGDVLIVLSAGDADRICTQILEVFG